MYLNCIYHKFFQAKLLLCMDCSYLIFHQVSVWLDIWLKFPSVSLHHCVPQHPDIHAVLLILEALGRSLSVWFYLKTVKRKLTLREKEKNIVVCNEEKAQAKLKTWINTWPYTVELAVNRDRDSEILFNSSKRCMTYLHVCLLVKYFFISPVLFLRRFLNRSNRELAIFFYERHLRC